MDFGESISVQIFNIYIYSGNNVKNDATPSNVPKVFSFFLFLCYRFMKDLYFLISINFQIYSVYNIQRFSFINALLQFDTELIVPGTQVHLLLMSLSLLLVDCPTQHSAFALLHFTLCSIKAALLATAASEGRHTNKDIACKIGHQVIKR